MKINSLSYKTANFIKRSKLTQKTLKMANSNPSLTNSAFVFLLSTTVRPTAIMFTPSEEKDKIYSASRSMASGVADLAISAIFFMPLNAITKSMGRKLHDLKGSIYFKNKAMIKTLNKNLNRVGKWAIAPIQTALLLLVMPKVLKTVFKESKGEN